MARPLETPFDSVENARDYVHLLAEAVIEAKRDIEADIAAAAESKSDRRLEALRLVRHKLDKLEQNLRSSSRVLNDLRTLRRLLLDKRTEPEEAEEERAPKE